MGEMKWQPIETAPKDGASPILVAVPTSRGTEICVAQYIHWDGGGTQWCLRLDEGFTGLPRAPTHWMPLPKPPKLEEADNV